MQRFNAYESGALPLADSIRGFYNLHVARMPMPAFMHACDTFPALMLGVARAVACKSHIFCAVYLAITGDSMLLCQHGLEAHGSFCQPFAGYGMNFSAWQNHDTAVWKHDGIDRHQDVL